jgi:uncharacterized membrane protein YeaQ/YmgE (transglycosylase-associated protein family)
VIFEFQVVSRAQIPIVLKEGESMKFLLLITGSSLGGWGGWFLGKPMGTMTAFLLSVIGTAVGIYAARWFIREYAG